MSDFPLPSRYNRTAMLLHWLVALLLLGQFAFGWLLDDIPRGTPARGYFFSLHKSTGMLIGLLILARIIWRLTHTPPALPDSVPRWQRQLAAMAHYGLYALMVVMPLSGYVASNFSKYGVHFFNVYKLAPWGEDNKAIYAFFNQTHGVASWLLLALVLVHVLAALKHVWVDRDTLFYRMWPQRVPRQ